MPKFAGYHEWDAHAALLSSSCAYVGTYHSNRMAMTPGVKIEILYAMIARARPITESYTTGKRAYDARTSWSNSRLFKTRVPF